MIAAKAKLPTNNLIALSRRDHRDHNVEIAPTRLGPRSAMVRMKIGQIFSFVQCLHAKVPDRWLSIPRGGPSSALVRLRSARIRLLFACSVADGAFPSGGLDLV